MFAIAAFVAQTAVCSDFVKDSVVLKKADRHVVSCSAQLPLDFQPAVSTAPVEAKALPQSLDWLLNPDKGRSLSDRVMARLIQSEAHETDVWLRQDYRQACICVSLASKGNTAPFVVSSYQIYGKHPDKVWPVIMHNRRMKLAREFGDWWDAEGNRKPDIPKIPAKRAVGPLAAGVGADARGEHLRGEGIPSAPALLSASEATAAANAGASALHGLEAPVLSSADKFVNERLAALVPPKKETA